MIQDSDITWMQGFQEGTLPDEMEIGRVLVSVNAVGTAVETTTWSAPVACHLAVKSPKAEGEFGGVIREDHTYMLTYPKGVSLSAGETVRIRGVVYGVVSVETPSDWRTVGRAELRRFA